METTRGGVRLIILFFPNSDKKPSINQSLGGEVPPAEGESYDGDELGDEVGDKGGDKKVGGKEVGEAEHENLEYGQRELVTIEEDRVEGMSIVRVEDCLLRGEPLRELNVQDSLQEHLCRNISIRTNSDRLEII